ncbi:MAG TPA: DUF5615 family PIN-like protein [Planctomycetota bacterium]|nr:DUF5615 family PIN-like protein [Planctomycetota bacterium]
MRILADQGISPRIVSALVEAGHDAVHVRDLGMSRAPDSLLVARADEESRIILTEDTDFGGLLVPAGRSRPSVILFRNRTGRASVRIRLLVEWLPLVDSDLKEGAVVVIEDAAVRVRHLRGGSEGG